MNANRTRLPRAFLSRLVLAVALGGAGAAGAQQTTIQRGEYLARAGDCVSCHTATAARRSPAGCASTRRSATC